MITCRNILAETYGEAEIYPTDLYQEKYQVLKQNLFDYFWDEELGAFIDCYESGRRNVTRHVNIFAVFILILLTKNNTIDFKECLVE